MTMRCNKQIYISDYAYTYCQRNQNHDGKCSTTPDKSDTRNDVLQELFERYFRTESPK